MRILISESQYKKILKSGKVLKEYTINDEGEKVGSFDVDLGGNLLKRWNKNDSEHVKRIQHMLKVLEYDLGSYGPNKDGVDGKFGPFTEKATETFQMDVMPDRPEEWDGIMGPNTYNILVSMVEEKSGELGITTDELIDSVEEENDSNVGEILYDPTKRYNRSDYINLFKGIAIKQMKKYGVPASITLAQGILESGNGNSYLARKGNNHFGIKCHGWNGEEIYADDDKADECFRKYNNTQDSYIDHSKFLQKNSRYDSLFDLDISDYEGWAEGLQRAGYATSNSYAKKLINLIERNDLDQYDSDIEGEEGVTYDIDRDDNLDNSLSGEIRYPSESRITSGPDPSRWNRPHHGYDIVASKSIFRGDGKVPLIVCNNPGTVTHAGKCGTYGNLVIIKHSDGEYSGYGHLDSVNVSDGDQINIGDVIGVEGTTGHSDGNHLHFEFRVKRPDDVYENGKRIKKWKNRCGGASPDVEVRGFDNFRPIEDADDYFYYQASV